MKKIMVGMLIAVVFISGCIETENVGLGCYSDIECFQMALKDCTKIAAEMGSIGAGNVINNQEFEQAIWRIVGQDGNLCKLHEIIDMEDYWGSPIRYERDCLISSDAVFIGTDISSNIRNHLEGCSEWIIE